MVSSSLNPAGHTPLVVDPSSPIPWNQLREHLNSQLERARLALEAPGQTEDSYNVLRGDIRTLKKLLDLPNQAARRASVTQHAPSGEAP